MTDVHLQEEAWADVEEGTEALLDEWLVATGVAVTTGQVVANVIVAKTTYEVVAPVAGCLGHSVAAQDNFARGAAIATVQA